MFVYEYTLLPETNTQWFIINLLTGLIRAEMAAVYV